MLELNQMNSPHNPMRISVDKLWEAYGKYSLSHYLIYLTA